jgi:hypothetical protein
LSPRGSQVTVPSSSLDKAAKPTTRFPERCLAARARHALLGAGLGARCAPREHTANLYSTVHAQRATNELTGLAAPSPGVRAWTPKVRGDLESRGTRLKNLDSRGRRICTPEVLDSKGTRRSGLASLVGVLALLISCKYEEI